MDERGDQVPGTAVIQAGDQIAGCPAAVFFLADERRIVVDIPLFLADGAL